MKMSRRILVITICVLLLLSISLVSFASSYKTFFRDKLHGYMFSGNGRISTNYGEAICMASEIIGQAHIPPEDCTTKAWVTIYGRDGEALGSHTVTGTTKADAICMSGKEVYNTSCYFQYMSFYMGPYKFYDLK